MVWGRADDRCDEQAIPADDLVSEVKKKAATATILSNAKRNVLEAHCSMTPRMFDNIGWQR